MPEAGLVLNMLDGRFDPANAGYLNNRHNMHVCDNLDID
jgi:hypothetical protein